MTDRTKRLRTVAMFIGTSCVFAFLFAVMWLLFALIWDFSVKPPLSIMVVTLVVGGVSAAIAGFIDSV